MKLKEKAQELTRVKNELSEALNASGRKKDSITGEMQ